MLKQIIIYQNESGEVRLDVRFDSDKVLDYSKMDVLTF